MDAQKEKEITESLSKLPIGSHLSNINGEDRFVIGFDGNDFYYKQNRDSENVTRDKKEKFAKWADGAFVW